MPVGQPAACGVARVALQTQHDVAGQLQHLDEQIEGQRPVREVKGLAGERRERGLRVMSGGEGPPLQALQCLDPLLERL